MSEAIDRLKALAQEIGGSTDTALVVASNLMVAAQISRLCDLLEKPIGDVHFVSQPLDSDSPITLIGKGLFALQQRIGEYVQKQFFDN